MSRPLACCSRTRSSFEDTQDIRRTEANVVVIHGNHIHTRTCHSPHKRSSCPRDSRSQRHQYQSSHSRHQRQRQQRQRQLRHDDSLRMLSWRYRVAISYPISLLSSLARQVPSCLVSAEALPGTIKFKT
jgi:hypothetical protein